MSLFPYENQVEPETVNIDRGKLQKLVNRFIKQGSSGAFPGGQLVLRRYGKLVLNQSNGLARGFRTNEGITPVKVQCDTPFPVFSVGKPVAAIAIALLEERQGFDIHTPIADVIPEFGRHGKDDVTTLDVLTHRAGILLPELVQSPNLWTDREVILEHLINAKPIYPRGTFAYQPFEYGWLLSEICLRVEGRSLPDFVAQEISAPLGLPTLQYGLAGHHLNSLAITYWLGKDRLMVAGVDVADSFEAKNNSAAFFNSLNPSDTMVADAASLAAFYEFLVNKGGINHGEQLLSEEKLLAYTTQGRFGWDKSTRNPMVVGQGFILGSPFLSTYGWGDTRGCFGHAGGFSSLAFGDYDTGIAVAIVTNGNRDFMDLARRFIPLAHGLRKACN